MRRNQLLHDADAYTTADVIDRVEPPKLADMNLKAYMRDRAMRGEAMSPAINAALERTPEGKANIPWLAAALQAAERFSPEAMAAANFVGPRVRLPARPSLDPSPAAKALRASQQRYLDDTFYHGTTHQFDAFADPPKNVGTSHNPGKYSDDTWHGPAIYASTSRSDAADNYPGPDFRQRIARRAEALDLDGQIDRDNAAVKRAVERMEREIDLPRFDDPAERAAYAVAYNEIAGDIPSGRVLSLRMAPRNPVYVGGSKDTLFTAERPFWVDRQGGEWHVREAKRGGGDKTTKKFDSERDAYEFADDLNERYMAKGPGMDVVDRIRATPGGSDLADALYMELMDMGGIRASSLENSLRRSDIPMMAMEEGLDSNVLPRLYRELGHDAVIMANADKQFRMGMPENTTHIAMFDPRRVRDTEAMFDPRRINSRNLMAGLAGAAVIPGTVVGAGLNQLLQD